MVMKLVEILVTVRILLPFKEQQLPEYGRMQKMITTGLIVVIGKT